MRLMERQQDLNFGPKSSSEAETQTLPKLRIVLGLRAAQASAQGNIDKESHIYAVQENTTSDVLIDAADVCDDFQDPELFQGIGDQYQAEIPPLIAESECGSYEEIFFDVCDESDDLTIKDDTWSDIDEASFLLGLYIFGKNHVLVKKFVETKGMGEILSFYYGKFYRSEKYHRWSACRKTRSKRCIKEERIFTGARKQELVSRLVLRVPEECKNTLLKVIKAFGEGKMSLEEYVFTLRDTVGLDALVEAVGIGKGNQDLTGMAEQPLRSNDAVPVRLEIPIGSALSTLMPSEIMNFLTGGYRLSKSRSTDLFWEAVWPRLLARGWHAEPRNNQSSAADSVDSLVYLVPGVEKFTRGELVKGTDYFDSISDILGKVMEDPGLLELEIEAAKGDVSNNERSNEMSPLRKRVAETDLMDNSAAEPLAKRQKTVADPLVPEKDTELDKSEDQLESNKPPIIARASRVMSRIRQLEEKGMEDDPAVNFSCEIMEVLIRELESLSSKKDKRCLSEELKNALDELAKSQSEVKNLKSQLNSLQTTLAGQSQKSKSLESQKIDYEKKDKLNENLEKELSKIQDEYKSVSYEKIQLAKEKLDYETKCEVLRHENAFLESKCARLSTENENQAVYVGSLKKRVKKLFNKRNEARDKVSDLEKKLSDCEGKAFASGAKFLEFNINHNNLRMNSSYKIASYMGFNVDDLKVPATVEDLLGDHMKEYKEKDKPRVEM